MAAEAAIAPQKKTGDWSDLPPALRALIAGAGLPASSFGVQIEEVSGRGQPLASLNADEPYQLASTAKVITALAALDLLGAHYRWRTYAFLGGPLSSDGRLLGDLLIVGGGDSRLRSTDLLAWFERMQRQGLREIWGNVVLDRFAFRLREDDHSNTPPPATDRPHHVRPDALTLDEGVLHVNVQAVARGKPLVQLTPPLAGLKLVNELSAEAGCAVWAQAASAPGVAPTLALRGRWSAGCGSRALTLAPLSHDEFTVRAVEGLWQQAGGRLRGRVIDKRLPDRASLLPLGADGEAVLPHSVHLSEPLPQVIREINKSSDNLGARNLMLSLVRGFPMRAATLAEARQRVDEWLLRQGLQPGDISLENGSGLSRGERGKPRALVQLLRRAWASNQAQAFIDSLPIAGVDGTLAHRMTSGKATGSAFLKTGTLLDTRALAGYVKTTSGRTYALAALVNHPEAQRATPSLDALVEWVARNG
ncbi:D-alanyl-D-alanine carboxypeptidase/D-alanyl-D-alanine-endopeptidase [Aquincola sp. S2]|uniref:D-alanyl-D-alanine carboxypeptidase/D-alanyl-D-alanine-endopeptidase n=1 Tax=Pseudaquabacterium terrae TaxID=2732868 RepID=A0ABX2EEV7_9BURK|nr:D-alanyl-D-alanine carboxypeptidase/D-alanyl-D-alanine-endopeptidase [Aquabacterium terrae]NRF67141.1 D-alanyl-D-alanine carboxypeptidase/D-alanyl-D-alanine-endopeptidase [Aquabacterium terrae]